MTAKFNYHSNGRRRFNINGWWPARPGRTARAVSGFLAVAVAFTCTLQAFAVKPPPKKGEAKKGEDVPAAVKREQVKLIGAESESPKKDAAATTPEAKGPRPVIKVEALVHDFGTVWVGPKLQHTFIIKNEGKKTLKIEKIRPALEDGSMLKEIPKRERFVFRASLEQLLGNQDGETREERNEAILSAHLEYGYSLSEIARHLGLHYTTISKIVKEGLS